MRHATAGLAVRDFDRPLTPEGKKEAEKIGRWLLALGLRPDVALVSAAKRTLETWDAVASQMPEAPSASPRPDLYDADVEDMHRALRSTGEARTVMIVGHNPTIANYARSPAGWPKPDHPDFVRFPPGSTVAFEYDGPNWRDFWPATANPVLGFAVPQDLAG